MVVVFPVAARPVSRDALDIDPWQFTAAKSLSPLQKGLRERFAELVGEDFATKEKSALLAWRTQQDN
jgi:hypothetical protein